MFCWVDCSESRCAQRRAPRFGAVLKESCVLHMDGKVQKEVFAKQFPMMVGKTEETITAGKMVATEHFHLLSKAFTLKE